MLPAPSGSAGCWGPGGRGLWGLRGDAWEKDGRRTDCLWPASFSEVPGVCGPARPTRDHSLITHVLCLPPPRPPRFRRAHRCQSGHRRHPLLEQELGQGSRVRDVPSPEPGPHHARLPDLPPGLVRAGEGLPRGGLGRGGPGLAAALWTWPWAGGSSVSQNKAQACRGPEGLSQSVGRSLSHTHVAATSCSLSRPPRTRDERPRPPRAWHITCDIALPRFTHRKGGGNVAPTTELVMRQ